MTTASMPRVFPNPSLVSERELGSVVEYVCDTYEEIPLVELQEGDTAYVNASGKTYTWTSAAWVQTHSEPVEISSLADFPAPVDGVITVAGATAYVISGPVDIGPNRIEVGAKTSLRGTDRINDILSGTGTGALITCDSSITVKTILTLENLTLKNPNGSLLNFTSSASNQSLVINNCTLMDCQTAGVINNSGAIVIRNTALRGPFATGGFTFTGTGTTFTMRDCNTGTVNAGTLLAFGTSVWQLIVLGRNQFNSAAGQTIISSSGANVTVAGKIAENIFWGAGAFASGLTNADSIWNWHDNVGFANSAIEAAAAWGAITGIPSTFPPVIGSGAGDAVAGNDTRLTDSRTPLSHAHAPGDITGTAVITTDPRLSDSRTPLAHNQAATTITEDATHRFATDAEKTAWNGKEPGNSNIQAHVISAHAPSNAQKNSDITIAEIEAKLTGVIASHSHAGGGGGLPMTTVEKDLGTAQRSGTFDIEGLSGLTAGRPVLIQQAAGPYTGKGTLEDEAEELTIATAYALNTTTIRAYWSSMGAFISGNVKFNYSAA